MSSLIMSQGRGYWVARRYDDSPTCAGTVLTALYRELFTTPRDIQCTTVG